MLTIEMFKNEILDLVSDIADLNYDKIDKEGKFVIVNKDDFIRVINEYGCRIDYITDDKLKLAECYFVKNINRLDIYLPLWTLEEGRSDLTLSLSCRKENLVSVVEIIDLGVL